MQRAHYERPPAQRRTGLTGLGARRRMPELGTPRQVVAVGLCVAALVMAWGHYQHDQARERYAVAGQP